MRPPRWSENQTLELLYLHRLLCDSSSKAELGVTPDSLRLPWVPLLSPSQR